MSKHRVPLTRETWVRLLRAVVNFATSEVGWRATALFGLLLLLLFAINGLNVVNSYVARDFMTAIAGRDHSGFFRQTLAYLAVFGLATIATTFYRFSEERLALLWRHWLTGRLIGQYLDNRVYYHLQLSDRVPNPDQRIADDTRAFTATTLSFSLMVLNASFTVVAFAGVLWTISQTLFLVAVLYAILGSALTLVLGRPLVWLSYNQSDQEANFRSELIRVRENAESVALTQREDRLRTRLLQRLEQLTDNWCRVISVNRNLTLFSTGYNYLIQIIPALIIAPAFMRGEVEFGVITQSAMAFSQLLGAFSLIVTQFASISSFAAVVARLGSLGEGVEQIQKHTATGIATTIDEQQVAYQHVTLNAPDGEDVLLRDLSVVIAPGTKLIVQGPNEAAVTALFDATAGLWSAGEGRVLRPSMGKIMFVPERPYLAPGSLRQVLLPSELGTVPSDDQIMVAVDLVGASEIVRHAGGLAVEKNWDDALSLSEQQQLAIVRAALAEPRFIVFERLTSALDTEYGCQILQTLSARGITCVVFGSTDAALGCFDTVLELHADGSWKWRAATTGSAKTPG